MTDETTPRPDPAHTARNLLVPALAELEARIAPPSFASRALESLHEAPDDRGFDAASAVAHTLAFLNPLVSAAQRRRREVLLPEAVPSVDGEALRALADEAERPGRGARLSRSAGPDGHEGGGRKRDKLTACPPLRSLYLV